VWEYISEECTARRVEIHVALNSFPGGVMPLQNWVLFALGSAFFAALTAIFGKLGVAGINSNLATFIRTIVILIVTAGIISMRSEWQKPDALPANSWLFLILSGIATGLSWLCYYRALQLGPVSKVAPIDKLSVAFAIVFGILFLSEKLTWPIALGGSLIVAGSIVIIAF
jgi:transporter family protein